MCVSKNEPQKPLPRSPHDQNEVTMSSMGDPDPLSQASVTVSCQRVLPCLLTLLREVSVVYFHVCMVENGAFILIGTG